MNEQRTLKWLPWIVAGACVAAYIGWSLISPPPQELRKPIPWKRTGAVRKEARANDLTTSGPGIPSTYAGDWPQFRGVSHDNIATPLKPLARAWPAAGPKILWRAPVGDGYASPAVHKGRVYLLDYDLPQKRDAIRCLSLDDGREIWRTSYLVDIKYNHGRSRTIPAATDKYVVSLGPMGQIYCCDAASGKVVWKKDLSKDYQTVMPLWYAGQCPLIDGDRVIIAPAAKPLMLALDLATGKELWRTKDHDAMEMTHTSIATMTFEGKKQYIYVAFNGICGVAADTGEILWTHPVWNTTKPGQKASAYVPTPVVIDGERIFFTAGYGAGSIMLKLARVNGKIEAQELWKLPAATFSSDQHTPILYKDHLYSTIPPLEHGELACLDLATGKRLWSSGAGFQFGLGPYLMTADGLILALGSPNMKTDEIGMLHLGTVDPSGYKELARARLLTGREPWAPMALAGNRLLLRDMGEMICVDLE